MQIVNAEVEEIDHHSFHRFKFSWECSSCHEKRTVTKEGCELHPVDKLNLLQPMVCSCGWAFFIEIPNIPEEM